MIIEINKKNTCLHRLVPRNINTGKSSFVATPFDDERFFANEVILKPGKYEEIKQEVEEIFGPMD